MNSAKLLSCTSVSSNSCPSKSTKAFSLDAAAFAQSAPTTSYVHDPFHFLGDVEAHRSLARRKKSARGSSSSRVSIISQLPPPSPFTERNSFHRQWGGSRTSAKSGVDEKLNADWRNSDSPTFSADSAAGLTREDDDIAARLPELREVLELLKRKRQSGVAERPVGSVYLVGTGPGDPELLTLKAAKVIRDADLILYDRLVSSSILDLTKPDARLLYVGKTSGYHTRTQEEIHTLLLNFAQEGAKVVRLKGGDPLVFGRGGEEIDFLQKQGIQVQIVPGITSASGIAAELNIPLTHRGLANSVRFLTGHSRKGGEDPLHVAESAADVDSTLVIYMGLSTLPGLVQKLMENGLPENTPSVAIERGTTPQQRFVFSPLGELVAEVQRLKLVSPTLIIIGRVVALSHHWQHPCLHNTRAQSSDDGYKNPPNPLPEPRNRLLRGPDPLLPSQTTPQ